jgi:phosphomannomutase
MSLLEDSLWAQTPSPQDASARTAISPTAIRAYDIRGVAGRQVTAAGARALGLSYAQEARERGLRRIAVGRDGRISSPALERALVMGLAAGGMQVTRIGLCPTPQLAFAVRRLGLDGAVMVTASHNPPDENGFKLLLGAERIHGLALAGLAHRRGQPSAGGSVGWAEIGEDHVQAILATAGELPAFAVAWDCGNGAVGPTLARLIERLPGRHLAVNATVDGRFPNHHPDPAVAANLAQLSQVVLDNGCDLGVAFDGDGDRIGVVDETGEPLSADLLVLFLAQDLLKRRPGAGVVGDIKSSRLLFDGVTLAGGRAAITSSGYVLVREAMRRQGALLAGELSGHIFFSDEWDGADDALYAAIRVLRAMAAGGQSLGEFRRTLPATVVSPEWRIPTSRAAEIVAAVAGFLGVEAFDPQFGLRCECEDGWWLMRASGTEPKVTCRCESGTALGLERLKGTLRGHLRAHGLDPLELR